MYTPVLWLISSRRLRNIWCISSVLKTELLWPIPLRSCFWFHHQLLKTAQKGPWTHWRERRRYYWTDNQAFLQAFLLVKSKSLFIFIDDGSLSLMGGCGKVSWFPWTTAKAQIHKYMMFLSMVSPCGNEQKEFSNILLTEIQQIVQDSLTYWQEQLFVILHPIFHSLCSSVLLQITLHKYIKQ